MNKSIKIRLYYTSKKQKIKKKEIGDVKNA